MTSKSKIRVASRDALGESSRSFEQETTSLLRSRLLILLSIGFLASLASYFNDRFITLQQNHLLQNAFTSWYDVQYLSCSAFFLLGSIAVPIVKQSQRALQWIAFTVMALSILNVTLFFATLEPQIANLLFVLAMILFVFAAFVPAPIRFQIGLVMISLVTAPLFFLFARAILPEVQAFWAAKGGNEIFFREISAGVGNIIILGAITIVVNKTLYNLRRKLFEAKRLGNYIIKEKLGEGGMGKVYVAEHAMIQRPTAVKVLEAKGTESEIALARFEREVQLCAMLTHPNTITIYDYGRTRDNTFYYAMEFLEGMDLQRFVEKFGPQPAERVVFVLKQVCYSLAEAHARKIIHRDIKPSNIFLTRRGGLYDFVKVLDFGLAKQVQQEGQLGNITNKGAFFGTPRYVAPESVYGTEKVDHRVDIYNLGAVAYWLLAGLPLFASSSDVELIVDHVKTIPQRPSQISEIAIPAALEDFVMKCLEKSPDARYQSASEMLWTLESVTFEFPWDECKAREWWSLHLNLEDQIHVCPDTGKVMVPETDLSRVPAVVGVIRDVPGNIGGANA